MVNETLDRLEHDIAVHGLDGHDDALAGLADLLVRTGALPAVAGILADPAQPEPVRLRAFARASRALRAMPQEAFYTLVA